MTFRLTPLLCTCSNGLVYEFTTTAPGTVTLFDQAVSDNDTCTNPLLSKSPGPQQFVSVTTDDELSLTDPNGICEVVVYRGEKCFGLYISSWSTSPPRANLIASALAFHSQGHHHALRFGVRTLDRVTKINSSLQFTLRRTWRRRRSDEGCFRLRSCLSVSWLSKPVYGSLHVSQSTVKSQYCLTLFVGLPLPLESEG